MSCAGLMENWWREVCAEHRDGERKSPAEWSCRAIRAVHCGRVDGENSIVAG